MQIAHRLRIALSVTSLGPLRRHDRRLTVLAAGQEWELDAAFEPLLRALASAPSVPLADLQALAPRLTPAQLRTWLGSMIRQGLLHAIEPGDGEG
ncbi:MAG: hypothetical protein EOO74_04245 [Myxococcales bacterium]|nr:MAG: hypothetical protein EOO74_04245 [Myxococcales bacterium]